MIYLLYGQPASGKTTLGKLLANHFNTPFIIDGDEFRKMFTNKNYGKDGREENIRNANAVATYLNKKTAEEGHVIVSLVNPYESLRKELKNNNKNQVIEILLLSDRDLRKEYHVKDFEVGDPDYMIKTDQEVDKSWEQLKSLLNEG
jgi:adenylylsulfate kinase-like enzyme